MADEMVRWFERGIIDRLPCVMPPEDPECRDSGPSPSSWGLFSQLNGANSGSLMDSLKVAYAAYLFLVKVIVQARFPYSLIPDPVSALGDPLRETFTPLPTYS